MRNEIRWQIPARTIIPIRQLAEGICQPAAPPSFLHKFPRNNIIIT